MERVISYSRKLFNKVYALLNLNKVISELKQQSEQTQVELDNVKIMLSKLLLENSLKNDYTNNIQNAEFKIFSQWGDDGIIQYIINNIEFKNKTFIEFGVENYKEANTRYLLLNNNWSGLVIDGSKQNIEYIKRDPIYWQYDLTAVESFITRDNINQTIASSNFSDDIGILSIDVDGNDYWIWEAITTVRPILVIIEFNAVFDIDRAITIPYSDDFLRQDAHYSYLYFGASLSAVVSLAMKKGYTFIGTNSASVNAYFLKNENLGNFKPKNIRDSFTSSKFSESRDRDHQLNFLNYKERQECIRGLPVFNVENNQMESF